MTLITCSECANIFSDKAPACPECGCPTELARPQTNPEAVSVKPSAAKPKQEQDSIPRPPARKRENLELSAKSIAEKKQGYMYNRANCRPPLIGIVVGAVAPATSIIWGLRQRSLLLGLLPVGLAATLSYYYPGDFSENKAPKYFIQALAGATAYGISRKLRIEAKEKGLRMPNYIEAKIQTNEPPKNQIEDNIKKPFDYLFSEISTEESTKRTIGFVLSLLAAGAGIMISRGIRDAIKNIPRQEENSRSTRITIPKNNAKYSDNLSQFTWDISTNCLKAEKELVTEARRLHPSEFAFKYEVRPGELVSQDWSKTAYPDILDAYQEMTWQNVYSSLTRTSPLAPKHCEVRDIWHHTRECTKNELDQIPWTSAERNWVTKATEYKDICY